MTTEQTAADLLYGVPAIAVHMGIRPRQVHHQIDKGRLPVFRIGGVICLRPSRLREWIAEREALGAQTKHRAPASIVVPLPTRRRRA